MVFQLIQTQLFEHGILNIHILNNCYSLLATLPYPELVHSLLHLDIIVCIVWIYDNCYTNSELYGYGTKVSMAITHTVHSDNGPIRTIMHIFQHLSDAILPFVFGWTVLHTSITLTFVWISAGACVIMQKKKKKRIQVFAKWLLQTSFDSRITQLTFEL